MKRSKQTLVWFDEDFVWQKEHPNMLRHSFLFLEKRIQKSLGNWNALIDSLNVELNDGVIVAWYK